MKVRLSALAQFAQSMAACLSAGLAVKRSLELSSAGGPRRLRRAVTAAAARCERGIPISEALEPSRNCLPLFFLPIIRAGELGGRQIEAYRLVHEYSERLRPTLDLVRKAWLIPLICIVAGWTARVGLLLYFGLLQAAWQLVQTTFLSGALLVFFGWLLLKLRFVKEAIDWLLLQLPFVRMTQIRLGLALFFATFRLVYETGGESVLSMLDLALATVSNLTLRRDLGQARAVLEEHGTFEEAFAIPELLEDWIKGALATGAMSGHLGTCLGQIVQAETLELEATLELFNRIYQRLVAFSVTLSIVGTLLYCLSALPPK